MDRGPTVKSPPPPPPPSRVHSDQKEGGGGRRGKREEGGDGHSTTIHQRSKPTPSSPVADSPKARSSSDKENANVTKPTQRRRKVRFTDMEPEPTPLLFNARDSMYMRAELQRELDFGIPAQEEAHRYARWCAEEAKREAAEAESAESGSNYAKADTVIHPKRLSTDLSRMDIDLANLGEDVSGLDVFSRVEASLEKQNEEKRKIKAQREKEKKEKKEGSTREKLKASLMVSPKRENSFSSLDEPSQEPPREKKGSRFLRKVISDRVMKPRDGSPSGNLGATDDARTREIADFFGKLAAQTTPGPPGSALLPSKTAPGKPPAIERSHSDIPISRKEVPPPVGPPQNNNIEGRRPSHPEVRNPPPPPVNSNGRPPSKSEPPPPSFSHSQTQEKASPQLATNGRVSSPTESPSAVRPITQSREDGNSNTRPVSQPKPRERESSVSSQQSAENGGDKRRPSLPSHHTYPRVPVPSHSHSQSMHHHPPLSNISEQTGSSSPSHQVSSKPRPASSGVTHREHQPPHNAAPPPPSQPPPPPPSRQAPAPLPADDFFSRIEQDIARNHPPPPPKDKKGHHDGDERTRDKGRKLFGKALEHIKHGGKK